MKSGQLGYFIPVLHSHLPYCRLAGRWPHGEEWLHEAAAGSYLPLLNALYDLRAEGTPFRLTIGITPVLAEQLSDPLVLQHLEDYLDDRHARAQRDIARFERTGAAQLCDLARFYAASFSGLLRDLRERYRRDIIGAWRQLQNEGLIEIITSAATHAYLPLLERDSSIYSQLRVGVASYERHFGVPPRAVWLPECAYRPARMQQGDARGWRQPGLEEFLPPLGLRAFFAETTTVSRGAAPGADDLVGPYVQATRRPKRRAPAAVRQAADATGRAYWVQRPGVAVLGRNHQASMQVWSAAHGYPGDFEYREFHKKDDVSGLQYWRVTGSGVDLGEKDYYRPERAAVRVQAHADHYVALLQDQLRGQANADSPGIIMVAFDTELFGHWWFEGVSWIKEVFRRLVSVPAVALATASEYVAAHPPLEVLCLPESSWGQGGDHSNWLNSDTQWMWPVVHEAERQMEELVARWAREANAPRLALNQAARELLLMESSDWPFLVSTGQARVYAAQRFREHSDRFQRLRSLLLAEGGLAEADSLARKLSELDNLFPDLDYRWFAAREDAPL